MEVVLSPSAAVAPAPAPATAAATFSTKPRVFIKLPESRITCNIFPVSIKLKSKLKKRHSPSIDSAFKPDNLLVCSNAIASSSYSSPSFSFPSSSTRTNASSSSSIPSTLATLSSTTSGQNHHWMVVMEAPLKGVNSKLEIIDYYVRTLQSVLGSEKDAQMCIYGASWDTYFGFCCDIDDETSRELARLPGVLSVKPDQEFIFAQKDCSNSEVLLGAPSNKFSTSTPLFPLGNSKHWLVKMDKHAIGVVSKAQMVDYYTQLLAKVMRNKKDAQMCIYHISWQSEFGFCCELDEDCAQELAGVRGVLSVQPDENFASNTKDYGGTNSQQFDSPDSSTAYETTNMKTKKLFVTGLSFYTSEKTLREAFEGFGEVVEVRVIMDKISKRSKGYAFVEYTREEAAAAALIEMNGKIINGWMITVDVAKSTGQLRPTVWQ